MDHAAASKTLDLHQITGAEITRRDQLPVRHDLLLSIHRVIPLIDLGQ